MTGRAGSSNSSFEFSGELLDGVFNGDEADGGSEFVDDDGELAAALLEVADEVEDGFGFRDDEDVAHDLGEAEGEVIGGEELPGWRWRMSWVRWRGGSA